LSWSDGYGSTWELVSSSKKLKNTKWSIKTYSSPENATNYINPNLNSKLKNTIIRDLWSEKRFKNLNKKLKDSKLNDFNKFWHPASTRSKNLAAKMAKNTEWDNCQTVGPRTVGGPSQ